MMPNTSRLCSLELSGFEFSELPKGEMFSIALNPYNGNVFMYLGKNELSGAFALSLMKRIVAACSVLERAAIDEPLRVLMGMTVEQVEELQEVEKERNKQKVISVGSSVVKAS